MPGPLKDYLLTVFWAGVMFALIHTPSHALTIDADQQLDYADALYTNQQYLRAAEEYQRFTFFFPDHPNNRKALFRAGESFLMAQDPGTAVELFKSLSTEEPLDALAIESYFMMAECYLQLKAPSHAVVQLNNIITLSDDAAVDDRAYYRIGWIHIEIADWEGAKLAFSRISAAGRERHGLDQLSKSLAGTTDIPTKSPALSGTLSIIPGGGQLYCKRYEDALIAFALNVGFIWAAHDAFDNEQYGLGGLLSFVGLGFYVGNIYGAVNDAHKYNHMQTRQFVDQLRPQHIRLPGPPDGAAIKGGLVLSLKIPF